MGKDYKSRIKEIENEQKVDETLSEFIEFDRLFIPYMKKSEYWLGFKVETINEMSEKLIKLLDTKEITPSKFYIGDSSSTVSLKTAKSDTEVAPITINLYTNKEMVGKLTFSFWFKIKNKKEYIKAKFELPLNLFKEKNMITGWELPVISGRKSDRYFSNIGKLNAESYRTFHWGGQKVPGEVTFTFPTKFTMKKFLKIING